MVALNCCSLSPQTLSVDLVLVLNVHARKKPNDQCDDANNNIDKFRAHEKVSEG